MNAPYQLFPDLAPAKLDELRESIREYGIKDPIHVDEHGAIIDGHHRKRIAVELGIDCPTIVETGLEEHDKRLLSFELNARRRHLTDAQLVLLGEKIEPDIAEHKRRRRLANLKQGDRITPAPTGTNGPVGDAGGRTRDQVAEYLGLKSGRTYERGKATIAQAELLDPEARAAIERGESTLGDLRRQNDQRVRRSNAFMRSLNREHESRSVWETVIDIGPDGTVTDSIELSGFSKNRQAWQVGDRVQRPWATDDEESVPDVWRDEAMLGDGEIVTALVALVDAAMTERHQGPVARLFVEIQPEAARRFRDSTLGVFGTARTVAMWLRDFDRALETALTAKKP